MRHRYSGRSLGRMTSHRESMFRNMMSSLIQHEVIQTTLPKAKELRRFFEPMVTLAKEDTLAHRRLAFDRLRDIAAVDKLFSTIGPVSIERKGGYLRILKCGFRLSDSSPLALVELVDRDKFEKKVVEKKKKTVSKVKPKTDAKEKSAKKEIKKESTKKVSTKSTTKKTTTKKTAEKKTDQE